MKEQNFSDNRYNFIKEKIKNFNEAGHSYETIKNLGMFGDMNTEMAFYFLKQSDPKTFSDNLSLDEWQKLVDFMDKDSNKRIVSLAPGAINNAEIATHPGAQWVEYKKALEEKEFSYESIENIENSSYQILRRLSKKTVNDEPVKGLVVGDVQSGKTANMIGLMSMAADYGFNFFIVFSGMLESLREQTASRMFGDLKLSGNLNWNNIKNPSVIDRDPSMQWENIDLSSQSKERYFIVSLKHKSRMDDLITWLHNAPEKKLNQLKILVIDDEADQASINTKSIDKQERTSINKALLKLINGPNSQQIGAINYISFTATPYANVLNEPGGLFPSDFVFTLPLSGDYIGPKQIFGLKEPEETSALPIVRTIPDNDFSNVIEIHDGEASEIPKSLKESITWFFITGAVFRIYGRKSPVSMLIHTSYKISDHYALDEIVRDFLIEIRADKEAFYKSAERIYVRETVDFTKQDFLEGMSDYSAERQVKDYPEFSKIKKQLKRVLDEELDNYVSRIKIDDDGQPRYHEGFHIVVDNSAAEDEGVRLVYPKKGQTTLAPMFIVIGGNTLSRGLTLEGLTTSYFLRTTKQADTLMQMGRWFGYRKGYELLPRIWLDVNAKLRFHEIAQINLELKEEIERMAKLGESPKELGVKVKNSPDNVFLRLTSGAKMQSAEETTLDFQQMNKQTILLENDIDKLEENKQLTIDLLNNLEEPEINGNLMIFKEVPYQITLDYLSEFNFAEKDIFFSNIHAFIEWFKSVDEEGELTYADWNIVFSTKKIVNDLSKNPEWVIQNKAIKPVGRSRLGEIQDDNKTVSIGSLTSSSHYLADIEKKYTEGKNTSKIERSELSEIRKEAGYEKVPLLLIYPIDRNYEPQSKNRKPLDFERDPIGIGLYIPGESHNKNLGRHLKIRIKDVDKDIDYEKFEEEETNED